MVIRERLAKVRSRIAQAERAANRNAGEICLLAVSKTQAPEALICAYQNRQRHFGENYLQEAITKQKCLAHYPITWHFIGPIQSNKTRAIANHFSWVHSVDRIKIARRLNEHRRTELGPLNICLQVNIDMEESKSGVMLAELPQLCLEISKLENLRFRGLMAIPSVDIDKASEGNPFRRMRDAFEDLRAQGFEIDTLSMGMSADLEAAVAAGATIVRIGTSIFGPRGNPAKQTTPDSNSAAK